MLVSDFYNAVDHIAPFSSAEAWDNVGLLIGDMNAEVTSALVALDAVESVFDEALSIGANLIVTHHPVIFDPLKRIVSGTPAWRFVRAGISVICAHTNLDMAADGVNAVLAELLGLAGTRPMKIMPNGLALGLTGRLERPMEPGAFACCVKERLGLSGARYADGGKEITTVAVCGGSGGEYLEDAVRAGAQAYVTGEIKHHVLLDAAKAGITCVDAGHFETENIVVEPLAQKLRVLLPGAAVSVSGKKTIFYA